ncbi:MAG: MFS transporter, partial [Candidatus Binatia bacterium]
PTPFLSSFTIVSGYGTRPNQGTVRDIAGRARLCRRKRLSPGWLVSRREMEYKVDQMRRLPKSWVVTGSASLTFGFTRGIHSSFGVFYVALLENFGWSRGTTAGVYSMNLLVDAIASPIVGHLLDRHGPKRIVGLGCILLALGLLLSSLIRSLWEFYIFFGLVSALGLSFMGHVPHVVLISEWFSSKRAFALGVVYSATGVGIMLLVPTTQWLISRWGWAWVFQALAALVLLILMPLALGFYRHGPYFEGSPRDLTEPRNQWTARLALRSLQFWLLFFARVSASSGTMVVVTHQVAHVVDIGYRPFFAATVFGLMGITSTFGRLIFGYIADLFSRQTAYTLNILTALVGIGALIAARDLSQPWLLYVYLLFFGVAFGSRAVILSALSADIFSGKGFGSIFGFAAISVGIGGALGSWLGGVLYDVTGSYLMSLVYSIAVLTVSVLSIWLASSGWVISYDKRLWPSDKP